MHFLKYTYQALSRIAFFRWSPKKKRSLCIQQYMYPFLKIYQSNLPSLSHGLPSFWGLKLPSQPISKVRQLWVYLYGVSVRCVCTVCLYGVSVRCVCTVYLYGVSVRGPLRNSSKLVHLPKSRGVYSMHIKLHCNYSINPVWL